MKKSTTKTLMIIFTCLAFLVAAGGAWFLLQAMLNDFDGELRHFSTTSSNSLAAIVFVSLGTVMAAAAFFVTGKRLDFSDEKKFSFPVTFISAVAGLMCLLYFAFCVKEGLPTEKKGLIALKLAFTLLSAIFFFLKTSGLFAKKSAAAISGVMPALMCAFILLNLYFDSTEPLNAPLKVYESLLLVSLMLYFTAEAGNSIKRPGMDKKYAFAGIFAITMGGATVVSKLAARLIEVDSFNFNIIIVSLYAVLWLYAVISFLVRLGGSHTPVEESCYQFEKPVSDAEAEDAPTADGTEDEAEDEAVESEKADADESNEEKTSSEEAEE